MKPGCHSDYTPRRRLPYWSVSTGCGAYSSPEHYPGREHCESCRWRERMPRESWLRYWWRERRNKALKAFSGLRRGRSR